MPAARADFRRHLVPQGLAPVGADVTVVDELITQGLPHPIGLVDDLSLLLVMPTGLATAWRDAAPTAVVSASRAELVPAPAESLAGRGPWAPPRLVVLRSGRRVGAVALAAGLRVVVPESDPVPGSRVALEIREWDLRAGSLRGPGDVGSRIVLAWRRVDRGIGVYTGWTGHDPHQR